MKIAPPWFCHATLLPSSPWERGKSPLISAASGTPVSIPEASQQPIHKSTCDVSCSYSHTLLNCFYDKAVPLPTLIFSRIYLYFVLSFVHCHQRMLRASIFMAHSTPTYRYLWLRLLIKWLALHKSNQIMPHISLSSTWNFPETKIKSHFSLLHLHSSLAN